MKVKLLTAGFDDELGGFDDGAIEAFMAENDVIDVQSQFFHHEGRPYWSLLVRYRAGAALGAGSRSAAQRRDKTDWRETLDDVGKARFDRIKVWRVSTGKQQGVAPFIILTNQQLAALVRRMPASITEMREVEGIGEKTADRYGKQLLALLTDPTDPKAGS